MGIFLKRFWLGHENGLVKTWSMQKYDVWFLYMPFSFLHILSDMLLKDFFVCPSHWWSKWLYVSTWFAVSIELSSSLFATDDVFWFGFGHDAVWVWIGLKDEFPTMTQNNHPFYLFFTKYFQRVKIDFTWLFFYTFKNTFLSAH